MRFLSQTRARDHGLTRPAVLLLGLLIAGTAGALHPLEPADTSSPRATMKSFLTLTEEVTHRYRAYRDSPTPETQDALFAGMRDVYGDVLDLSQIPPAVRREAAEKQVREWAAAHTLPFPEFAEDYRKQITDTLDYPPEGSSGAERA